MASLKKRGKIYYAQYYQNGKQIRENLHTTSLQMAKIELLKIETRLAGDNGGLPTKTPLKEVLTDYCEHLYAVKTAKNARKDISYLRAAFGEICPEMEILNKKIQEKAVKLKPIRDIPPIESTNFEDITTADVSIFIAQMVRNKGITPKTANRYREIITRLFNWAIAQRGKRMPEGKNPGSAIYL